MVASASRAGSAREVAMSQRAATGRVNRDRRGLELTVTRRFAGGVPELWEWVTAPAHLKQWYGTVRGSRVPGAELTVRRLDSGGPLGLPELETLTVVECAPGLRYTVEFALDAPGPATPQLVTVSIADLGNAARLFVAHRLPSARAAGEAGPAWEFSLDRLVAAHAGEPVPSAVDYVSQGPYYERLAMDGDPVAWPPS